MLTKSLFVCCLRLSGRYSVLRYFTTNSLLKSKSAAKYARKFLAGDNGKKRIWHDGRMMANPEGLSQPQAKGEGNTHRLQILNKVFLEKISDIMATGEVSSQLSGHGVEITKVQVLPNVLGINVYWISKEPHLDDIVSKVLQENAPRLRHELSQLRVLGHVPRITFVRDEKFYKVAEVEKRLSLADFGEGFEPTDATHYIKSSLTVTTLLNENLKDAIAKMEMEAEGSEGAACDNSQAEELPPDLPKMRSDVFSVDTDKIYAMVRQGMVRAEAAHRKTQNQESRSLDYTKAEDSQNNLVSRMAKLDAGPAIIEI
ncbi:uncharacterized protein LOC119575192 [Penaeus monodon]|uniref:uncharacterized protein LOC119575192 n=1 Tax=Penaeus monodon TaxID=6687 RepID=UPI0018A72D90|nr:uncharacterized protein LOC119575192 [Penaeus monodon]